MAKVQNPKIGSIVRHTGWGTKSKHYPCDVYIVSGQYEVGGRVSNFWKWRRVLDSNGLGKIEKGCGDFEQTENKYEINHTVSIVKK